MEYLPVSSESISRAAEILRSGGLAAFPTETVYGLGADAYNAAAIVKIFEAKKRPFFDPLIIHISAIDALEDVANLSLLGKETRLKLFMLAENLWPGPLSIVLPKNENIPGIVTSGLPTAAVRFPDHEAAVKLIALSAPEGKHGAVAAPSANPFGALSPTRAEHVRDGLGENVDIILDGGSTRVGVESTVLDISNSGVKILRHGGAPKEAIESLIGFVQDASVINSKKAEGFSSPGQLKSHYAPRTPLFVFTSEEIVRLPYEKDAAYLFFDDFSRDAWQKRQGVQAPETAVKVLSPSGNVYEAAACLFETLHEIDKNGKSRIFAQFAPQDGIGAAINDRLTRASNL